MRRRDADITPAGERGFTLLELLVVIAIIALLITLLFIGISAARKAVRNAGDTQAIAGLDLQVQQFKSVHAFLPPLVHDGAPLNGGAITGPARTPSSERDTPVFRVPSSNPERWVVSVWDPGEAEDLEFLRRRDATGAFQGSTSVGSQDAWSDRRYSKFALAYYLHGALPEFVDGIEGPGMLEPLASGGFKGVGAVVGRGRERNESTLDTSASVQLLDGYVEASEFEEHGGSGTQAGGGDDASRFRIAVADREGRAYRYYRWERGNPARTASGQNLVSGTVDMNIPTVLLDPLRWQTFLNDPGDVEPDVTAGDTELRDASYAIVGAGPNGVFGTEPIDVIADALGEPQPMSQDAEIGLRRKAWEDNVTQVGSR